MRLDPLQRRRLIAGPRLTSASPDGPRPAEITPAIADRLAAQARDLAAWIGARKAAGATARAATARATVVATAPRTDAAKAEAIATTWAALRARATGGVR